MCLPNSASESGISSSSLVSTSLVSMTIHGEARGEAAADLDGDADEALVADEGRGAKNEAFLV